MRPTAALALSSLLLWAACASLSGGTVTAASQAVAFDQSFTLKPGDSVVVGAERVTVAFDRVTADSRCPRDVQCIRAGDATVLVRIARNGQPDGPVELKTTPGGATSTMGAFTLTLNELQPVPRAAQPTQAPEYRATFVLSKAQ